MDARTEELLLAIRAAPDDTALRLVAADHLAAQWPAHAAWIVAQCSDLDDDRHLRADLDAELPLMLRGTQTRRGFVEIDRWRFAGAEFVDLDPEVLFRLSPTCSAIQLHAVAAIAPIAEHMARFTELTIVESQFDAAELADADGLAHLTSFELAHTRVDDTLVRAVMRSRMPALDSLLLPQSNNPAKFSFKALRAIAKAAFAPTLRRLEVQNCKFKNLVEILPALPALRAIEMANNVVDARFAALPHRFEELGLEHCRIDDATAAALADSEALSAVRELNLIGNPFTPEGLATLLRSPNLGPLEMLTFGGVHGFDASTPVAAALAHSTARATLQRLLTYAKFGDDGARILAETDYPRLRDVSFVPRSLGPRGAEVLATAPWIGQLESLHLPADSITAQGAAALARVVRDDIYVLAHGASADVIAPLRERLGDRLLG